MSALPFTRLDVVSRRNDLRVVFRPDQLSFCQSMDVSYGQTSQSTMTAVCDDYCSDRRMYQKKLNNSKRVKKMFVIEITMKKYSVPDVSCTHRDIHKLSMSDGINVWDLILIHVKRNEDTEISWFTSLCGVCHIGTEMNQSCWCDMCFVAAKTIHLERINVSRLVVNMWIFIICRSCKVFLTFTAFIRLCLTRWSVTQCEFDAILPRSKWTPLLSLQSFRRAVINRLSRDRRDLRNDWKIYVFPVVKEIICVSW